MQTKLLLIVLRRRFLHLLEVIRVLVLYPVNLKGVTR